MKLSMQQRTEVTGRQDGKVESKQLGNFEEDLEDLDMDEDMSDYIWQGGKSIELYINDVNALKNWDFDGYAENDLPVDLKRGHGCEATQEAQA